MVIRALSFDLFDTLIDLDAELLPTFSLAGRTRPGTQGLLCAAARRFLEIDLERFVRELAETDRRFREARAAKGLELPTLERFQALARALGVADPAFAEQLTEVHMGAIRGHAVFVPHHERVLSELKAGYRIALCSNFSHSPTALGLLQEGGLLDYFDATVISEDVGIRKPRQEIFQAVLEELRLPASQVLHVGDRLEADVGGAGSCGMYTAWLTRRVADRDTALAAYEGPAPSYVLADLAELAPLLASA